MTATKRCSRCDETKPLAEFNTGSGAHGRHSYCQPCQRVYNADQRSKNPQAAAQARAYTRATSVLRERHRDEFNEIYRQALRYEAARADRRAG